jgi:hypothetical protein
LSSVNFIDMDWDRGKLSRRHISWVANGGEGIDVPKERYLIKIGFVLPTICSYGTFIPETASEY